MIEAIREIGEYSLQHDKINPDDPQGFIEIFAEDIQGNSLKVPRILAIEINDDQHSFSFARVSEEPYSKEKNSFYLYRFGSSRGTNVSPTSKVTEKIENTYRIKIEPWLSQNFDRNPYLLSDEDLHYIERIKKCLDTNRVAILDQLIQLHQNIKANKASAIITLIIHEKGNRYYLGEIPLFKKIFIQRSRASFSQKYNKESRSENQICSVCRKKRPEVFGFVSTYNFYTVDKPGMVSGGFDQSKAWKNYPVCLECALALEKGKNYLDKYSHFTFYGFDYYVIPKPLIKQGRDEIYQTLRHFREDAKNKIKITEYYQTLMSQTEDEILKYLSEKENSFLCNILIYQENNNEFKIEKYIEDIFPSRLKELFDAKTFVDNNQTLKASKLTILVDKKKTEKIPFEFTFESVYHFFGKELDQNARTYFLDIVSRIFSGKLISYPFILSGIIRKLRKQFAQDYSNKESVLRGLAFLLYLDKLKILSGYQEGMKMTNQSKGIRLDESSVMNQKAESLFKEFSGFFNTSAKRAVFLEGVLCQKLLNIQYHERNATPFRTKLQGLKLDQRKIQTLLPEIQNKLEEYKANYYRDLEQLVSALMIEAGSKWDLSKDEIAFYLVFGMNLADQFEFEKKGTGVNDL
jgi:CRISPR-associated protein Csh1